jgi:hypothetical protein
MSFVLTSTSTPFGACALLIALIGGNRLSNGNRGSQSNRRESSYCQCLKPSFVHHYFFTPKCSQLTPRGAFRKLRHPYSADGYRSLEIANFRLPIADFGPVIADFSDE